MSRKACLSFDENKNIAFSTYAYTVVKNELYAHGKKAQRLKKFGEIISLDAPFSNDFDKLTLNDVLADSTNCNVYDEIEKEDTFVMLDERERNIINLRLQGKTYIEIANEIGISRQRIHVILRDAAHRITLSNEMGRILTKRQYNKLQKNKKQHTDKKIVKL